MSSGLTGSGITEQTYYRWRKEYGGLKLEQARRMKQLEKENARLRRLVTRSHAGEASVEGGGGGKLLSPERDVARYSMPGSSIGCRSGVRAGCWGSGEGRSDTSRSSATRKMG